MAKYFRRKYRSYSYRRRPRRIFTRRTLAVRRYRNYFLRKQRRNTKPEIKYLTTDTTLESIPIQTTTAPGVNPTYALLPLSVPLGDTGTNDRNGKMIKTRKVRINGRMTVQTNITTSNNRPDCVIKYWIWACRRDYNECLAVITGAQSYTTLNPNSFTIVREGYLRVGNAGVMRFDPGSDSYVPVDNTYPSDVYWKWVIPHIRTINFGPNSELAPTRDLIDQEKHQLYITFANNSDWVVRVRMGTVCTFIDP